MILLILLLRHPKAIRSSASGSYFQPVTVQYPSQLRAKIHSKSAMPIGFLPSSLSFLTVSAVNAQTYGTVTSTFQ